MYDILHLRQLVNGVYARDIDLALPEDQNLIHFLSINRRPHFEVYRRVHFVLGRLLRELIDHSRNLALVDVYLELFGLYTQQLFRDSASVQKALYLGNQKLLRKRELIEQYIRALEHQGISCTPQGLYHERLHTL
jgi:hypothetical protein